MDRPKAHECNCTDPQVYWESSSGSHYDTCWLECSNCGKSGPEDFDMNGAIRGWNMMIERYTSGKK